MSEFDEISIEELRREIRLFNNDENIRKLENYYHTKSLPEIIGCSRKELAHSSFIAWILNNKESHLLQDYSVKKLLELIVIYSKEKQLVRYKELYDSIIVSDYELESIYVETERSIKGVGRLDIYVEFTIKYLEFTKKIKLIIENKVGTKEHSDQTTKYYDYYESIKEINDINLYVFLTPISSLELMELEEPECSCNDYIQINYQSIVDFILEPALNRNITEKTKFIIKEYLQSLSQPTMEKDDEEYKQGLIMALGTDERNLLTKFWKKNQKLILATLYAISSDPEQEKDTRDNATTALSNLSKGNKDRSLYSIKFNDKIEADKIKKSDIGYSTVKTLEKNGLINDEVFDFLRKDKSCSFLLIKLAEEMTETETKYSKYRVNNEPELIFKDKGYYIARNWGIGNIEKFIKKMTTKFRDLKYETHS
ncbi:MAG: PD-(D/E)XK nuclease family protein [Ichthyobacteriaceae bacterium]|nr:PD-(D/E)XK nuclease family protein [Ichthyobacteriaceae bacterium]